jgi:hypothetical protein
MEGSEALGSRRMHFQVYYRYVVAEDCAYCSDHTDYYLGFCLPARSYHCVKRQCYDYYSKRHKTYARPEHPFSLTKILIVMPQE